MILSLVLSIIVYSVRIPSLISSKIKDTSTIPRVISYLDVEDNLVIVATNGIDKMMSELIKK
jgi:hypothetical protein